MQLNKAENRWVRPSERQRELTEEEKETAEVFSKFQVRMNGWPLFTEKKIVPCVLE